ncbi:DUF4395 domain-containing protein [Paenibacillus eucommiae]|uniref:Membrane channel-forming protein YqfA (Hemolysin III family) n=1 Tax=Paenibacillus eucommiae TaxID=1355755 RepID=A0ABS4IZS5_9BACL|nr:DUF4395 domain-containing protein [Paenibacillus eucommiae]MBP1993094.1 putative membrane channel-forming protein YqfA (hemolysin III family) [Paenibacillus eucommiae]
MKEIPIPYVRSNQAAMVLFIALAVVLQQPWIIMLVGLVEVVGLIAGVKGNLFVSMAKPFLGSLIATSQKEAAELQRFNNSIAVTLLIISTISFLLNFQVAGYIFAGMVAIAAFVAICGYCIGCTLYYQYKRLRARTR